MSVVKVAVILNLVALPIGAGRVVHQHHIVILQIDVQILLVETLRSVFLRLLTVFAVGILGRPCELGRWNTVYLCEHLVYNLQLLLLHFKQFLLFYTLLVCIAQFKAELAQLCREQCRESTSVVACVALLHHTLGHNTVLCNKVGNAGECSTVAQRVLEQPLHGTVVVWLLACVNDALQKEVRLLQLVIEEIVYL